MSLLAANKLRSILVLLALGFITVAIVYSFSNPQTPATNAEIIPMPNSSSSEPPEKIVKTDQEWKNLLTEEQYRITRKKGTERPMTGQYWDAKDEGTYACICCELPLFSSETKYKSGTGWPSFWQPIKSENVTNKNDNTLFMKRVEVLCNRCDAHLGHVFEDGPQPTGLRYCLNSAALNLIKKEEAKDSSATATKTEEE